MGARGKKSLAEVSVLHPVQSRPGPLEGLTDDQAAEWVAVVDRMPPDWFPRETHQLLAQYCRHVVSARKISEMIEAMEITPDTLKDYDKLLAMQEREGRAMSSLATRMRISQQATYDKTKSRGKTTSKPWELNK